MTKQLSLVPKTDLKTKTSIQTPPPHRAYESLPRGSYAQETHNSPFTGEPQRGGRGSWLNLAHWSRFSYWYQGNLRSLFFFSPFNMQVSHSGVAISAFACWSEDLWFDFALCGIFFQANRHWGQSSLQKIGTWSFPREKKKTKQWGQVLVPLPPVPWRPKNVKALTLYTPAAWKS